MAGLTNIAKNDIQEMVANGTDPSWRVGANWYLTLFTADPTDAGLTTNEATFTGYARVLTTKASDWTVTGSVMSNANLIQFPECTGGSNIITHGAIMTASSGGDAITTGKLVENRTVTSGNTLQYPAGAISFTISSTAG